jgi:hypothetical protein
VQEQTHRAGQERRSHGRSPITHAALLRALWLAHGPLHRSMPFAEHMYNRDPLQSSDSVTLSTTTTRHVPARPCTQITCLTTLTSRPPATSASSSLLLLPTSASKHQTSLPSPTTLPPLLPTLPTRYWPSAKLRSSLCRALSTLRVFSNCKPPRPIDLVPSHSSPTPALRQPTPTTPPLFPHPLLQGAAVPCLPQYSAAVAVDASLSWE